MSGVRVRFAPSPTGLLHLGAARTALFNYLFAGYYGGDLILRIEDTDRERSRSEFERAQVEDLEWLGLSFEEGPYRQSERGELYEDGARRLTDAGLTYESTDESGRRALYFRPPLRSGSFVDELRGEVTFGGMEDFVIRKSDGTPSYNFAVVVDDLELGVTHVIRGEEHLSNTARQTLLYGALGATEPRFITSASSSVLTARSSPNATAPRASPNTAGKGTCLKRWSTTSPCSAGTIRKGRKSLQTSMRSRANGTLRVSGRARQPSIRTVCGSSTPTTSGACPLEELRARLEPFLEEPLPSGREAAALEAIREDMKTLSDAPRLLRGITGPVDPSAFVEELPDSSDEVFGHAAAELEGTRVRERGRGA